MVPPSREPPVLPWPPSPPSPARLDLLDLAQAGTSSRCVLLPLRSLVLCPRHRRRRLTRRPPLVLLQARPPSTRRAARRASFSTRRRSKSSSSSIRPSSSAARSSPAPTDEVEPRATRAQARLRASSWSPARTRSVRPLSYLFSRALRPSLLVPVTSRADSPSLCVRSSLSRVRPAAPSRPAASPTQIALTFCRPEPPLSKLLEATQAARPSTVRQESRRRAPLGRRGTADRASRSLSFSALAPALVASTAHRADSCTSASNHGVTLARLVRERLVPSRLAAPPHLFPLRARSPPRHLLPCATMPLGLASWTRPRRCSRGRAAPSGGCGRRAAAGRTLSRA